MTPDTSILEKLLVAETAAERRGFENTKKALTEMIEIERRSLLVRGTGFYVAPTNGTTNPRRAVSKRSLGDC